MNADQLLQEVRRHAEQDMLIAGTYGKQTSEGWKACSIGCVVGPVLNQVGIHVRWSEITGAPEIVGRLIDAIFESLPIEDRPTWHVRAHEAVIAAVQRGADLSLIGRHHASRTLARCFGYVGEGETRAQADDLIELLESAK